MEPSPFRSGPGDDVRTHGARSRPGQITPKGGLKGCMSSATHSDRELRSQLNQCGAGRGAESQHTDPRGGAQPVARGGARKGKR